MKLAEYLESVLDHALDVNTEGMHTRAFEAILRWQLEKETFKPCFGNCEISEVTLFEVSDDGRRQILINNSINLLSGELMKNEKGRWELVSSLSVVWSS